MRVLMLAPDYPPRVRTGIGSYVQCMARALVRHGQEVHVLTCETDGGPPDGEDEGVLVHRRPVYRIPGARRLLNALPATWAGQHLPSQAMTRPGRRLGLGLTSLVETLRLGSDFDVVESPDYFSPGWAIALAHRWPVITVLHTPLQLEAKYSNLPDAAFLRAACGIERWASGISSAISAPSKMVVEELDELGWSSARRASVDPIGVDLDAFRSDNGGSVTGRLLIVGHIIPRKGHDVLAAAVGTLQKEHPRVEVVAVGSYGAGNWQGRPYREYLQATIDKCGVPWRFIDQVDRSRLLDWYRTSSVVVVPSRFESFSMSAVEGMLCSRPVVLTDRCGVTEICPADAERGVWVARSGDADSLADTLEQALQSLPRNPSIGMAARETAKQLFDVDQAADRKVGLYRSLASV